jgi:LuxR family maltose regulon positive regulatory protein
MEQSGRRWRRMRLQCLLAQAYARQRRSKNAVELMLDTLLGSANNEMVYVFADEPWFLVDILEELPRRNSQLDPGYLQQVTAATKLVAQRIGELLVAKTQNNLLSLKETAIIRLVADGKANKEIARILNITDNTVETHLRRINLKLETRNRTHAVAKAREFGLLR